MAFGPGMVRFLLTLFHLSLFAGAALCVVYSLVRWGSEDECLPPMVSVNGKGLVAVTTQVPAICAGIFATFGAVSFLNVLMGVCVNYFWGRKGFMAFNMFLALLIGTYITFIAAMVTTYRLVWCDTVQQKMKTNGTCSDAALSYDKAGEISILTPFYNRLEIEMVGVLLLLPPSALCVFIYGITLCLPPNDDDEPSYTPILSSHQSHNPPPMETTGNRASMPFPPKDTTPLLVNLNDPHGMD